MTAGEDLQAAIRATLLEQARRNELYLSWLRVGAIGLVAVLDWLSYTGASSAGMAGIAHIAQPLASSAVTAASLVLALALQRGYYSSWLRFVVPLGEGLVVAGMFWLAERTLGLELMAQINALAVVGPVAAIYTLSGALRFHRGAVAITAVGGMAMFAGWAFRLADPVAACAGLIVLAALGGLAFVLERMVERAVTAEVGRLTLRRFLPARVVDHAHDDPMRLFTVPRSVDATVLVSDVRGFTSWSEDRSPADVLAFLNELQGGLADVVRAEGGTIDKFLGDGMLAVFGVPEPVETHADHALAAARAMHDFVERLNRTRQQAGEPAFRVGIGIHSGELIAGCLGSGLRLEFTVIGDTVNTAARLEGMTKEYDVDLLVSGATLDRLTTPAADLVALGEVEVRGRQAPLRVFTSPARS